MRLPPILGNNVFHGVKVYDDAEDQEVLTLVNPILLQIVETCERAGYVCG